MFCCPGCFPTRRGVVLGAAALAAARPRFAAAAAGLRWIDAHCHVFNAIDLPITEFLVQTQNSFPGRALSGLITVLAAGLKAGCPTAAAEIASLSGTAIADLSPQDDTELSTLATLKLIRDGDPAPASGAVRRPPPPANGSRLLEAEITRLHPGRPPGPATDAELADLADTLDGGFSPQLAKSPFGQIAWAQAFSAARASIIQNLVAHYPPGDDVMLTPAWVDYSRWLGIGPNDVFRQPTSIRDQLAVAAALTRAWARGVNGRRVLVTSFAPFDPARALLPDRNEPDPVDAIDAALAAGQIIGVKLYPPMGFQAIGNARLHRADFPEPIRSANREPGPVIDDALLRLYRVCLKHGAPIMAHCGDTNFAHAGYGRRSDPAFWLQLLARKGFANLRLNLAHFGGIWSWGTPDTDDGRRARQWATTIAGAIQTGRYPNLYADVGYASEFLTRDPNDAALTQSLAFLRTLLANRPKLRRHILYGSDWEMVGREQFEDSYPALIDNAVGQTLSAAERADFRCHNAARFLGLADQTGTAKRLAAFLGPNADLLQRFATPTDKPGQ